MEEAVKDAKCSTNVAAIFGVSGLVGKELARMLLSSDNWKVYGIARQPGKTKEIQRETHGYYFISCDLLDPLKTREKLSLIEDVTHIFWVTWASQFPLDSSECYEQNRAMMANALNAILPKAKSLRHVSLQTGTKHYFSLQGHVSLREIWKAIGDMLGVNTAENCMFSEEFIFSSAMGDKGGVWKEIVVKERLVNTEMQDLANWDFLDALFRFPIKMLCTRDKIDLKGFKNKYHVLDSICYWIDVMRKDKFIP